MKNPGFILLASLVAAALACSTGVNVPRVTTGPTQTVDVSEPRPAGDGATAVTLRMGAGSLDLGPGADGLVSGSIRYNVAEWKPAITRGDGRLTIEQSQGDSPVSGVPGDDVINEWKLKLGSAPLDLKIEAGAYRGTIALGGLALRGLEINDGASQSTVSFDAPNPEPLETFSYTTGASHVELTGLANANFTTLTFKGGAGTYTLDFSGTLQRDARVDLTAGVSTVTIEVPAGLHAEVDVTGGANSVRTEGGWTTSGDHYSTTGSGPTLTIKIDAGVGTVKLVTK